MAAIKRKLRKQLTVRTKKQGQKVRVVRVSGSRVNNPKEGK